jgi:alpha-ketoglutarate-dependent taurine dioxygenase/4-hydroxybenzoate polyprenyltransferase
MIERELSPFGLEVTLTPGTKWHDLDPRTVRRWVDEHRVLVLRGLTPMEPHELARASRALGPIQPWPFGAVHEIKRDPDAENYLYTERGVPLHWDGAFASEVPHWLVFSCSAAPPEGAGGETIFVDTIRVLDRASESDRARWGAALVRYSTERKAHYGGSFTSPVVAAHPTLSRPVIRYAEPVQDLNPVTVEPLQGTRADAKALMTELSARLHDPKVLLYVPWHEGDMIVADNHALLHGRRAFLASAPRHLLRVNVLDDRRAFWHGIRDAWRLRRPEFMRAEIPILLIPAFLSASRGSDFVRGAFWEGTALFWLLFQAGDLVNCLFDRDVDLHRKTRLSEAVTGLGTANVKAQVAVTGTLAAVLGAHLALTLARPWMAIAAVLGILLGFSYTAPPLRLKSRGLLQLAAYVGLLFVGPMTLVSGLFAAWPPARVVLVAFAYGTMQTGVLLVNTAEDLDEDEREHIRTVAVVLKTGGTMRLARALAGFGGLGLLVMLGSLCASAWTTLALLPLAITLAYNEHWLGTVARTTGALSEAEARKTIRKQGKRVPGHLEAGAWAALFAAGALFLARVLP